jgi:hypothetical protein
MTGVSPGPGAVFPLPAAPVPHRPQSRSPRVRQRFHRAVGLHALASFCVASLNFLALSFASVFAFDAVCRWFLSDCYSPDAQTRHVFPPCAPATSAAQERVLSFVNFCVSRFASRFADSPATCDGSSEATPPSAAPSSHYSSLTDAQWIIADKLSLPKSAASAELLNMLPPDIANKYQSPESLLLPPDKLADKKVPKPVVKVEYPEWCKVVRRARDVGLFKFVLDPKCENGVFATPKQDGQRFIVDCRPVNAKMIDSPAVALPTPDLLASIRPIPGRPLFVGKVDLDNFYHRIRLPDWLVPYFAMPSVRAGDVGLEDEFGADTRVWPCCAALPMGFSHSVFLAQAAHEHMLDTRTSLSRRDRIGPDTDLTLDEERLLHAVYIDDLITVSHSGAKVDAAIDEYLPVAEANGTPAKPSKIVRATTQPTDALGLEVDGIHHTVGLSVPKLQRLCQDTMALLKAGTCTGRDMEVLIGRWVWASLVRRPVLSVFSAVFRFQLAAEGRRFEIWPSVRRELLTAVGLAPLLVAFLDDPFFDRVLASDASSTGLGVTATRAGALSGEVPTIAGLLPQRPAPPPSTQRGTGEPSSCALPRPPSLPAPLDAGNIWQTLVSVPWRRAGDHINVLELRAVHTAVRWVISSPASISTRLLLLSDSTVCVFSLLKGRSSSPQLLPRLRTISALLLAAGLSLVPRWVPTDLNPADGPSRLH